MSTSDIYKNYTKGTRKGRSMSSRMLQTTTQQPFLPIRVGDHVTKQVLLTPAEISHLAQLCGDHNPLHHDQEFARRSRYRDIIAAGAHTSGLLIGLSGTYFSAGWEMVGLEYEYQLLGGVRAGEINLIWEIVAIEPTKNGQQIVTIEGAIEQDGRIMVKAKGKVLVAEKL
jgi:3-hydroxybutyryl-CoA dehydratase